MSRSTRSHVMRIGMVAYVNGWRMWGVPAPSVCTPPVRDTERTVCGYAPTQPEAMEPIYVPAVPPEVDPAQPIELPKEPSKPAFHWAVIPDAGFEFSGTAAGESELTFIGTLAIDPEEPRAETILRSDRTPWLLAIVGVLCLLGVLALLFYGNISRTASVAAVPGTSTTPSSSSTVTAVNRSPSD